MNRRSALAALALALAALALPLPGRAQTPITICYSGSPANIPDNNPAGVTSTIAVVGLQSAQILGLKLDFASVGPCTADEFDLGSALKHSYVGDLVVTLSSPAGTTVRLINRMDGGANFGQNFCDMVLDDSASLSIQTATGLDARSQETGSPRTRSRPSTAKARAELGA